MGIDKLTAVRLLAVFAFIVVTVGAWTRLEDAGLGCPDWPGCYGHLTVPQSDHVIEQANAAYPDAPFEAEKAWPEMIHRYIAGLLGLGILGLAVHAWWRGDPEEPRRLPLVLLILVFCQAAFGAWTVTLKLWPQVVTAHLLGGMATLSLLFLYSLRLERQRGAAGIAMASGAEPGLAPRRLALAALIVLVLQIGLGGWTSSNYAALACPDFPTCQGALWPEADFARGFDLTQDIGPNYLGGRLEGLARIAIHFTHRLGALIVAAIMIWLALRLWQGGRTTLASLLGATLALQLLLGVLNVVWSLPLHVAVAHNGVAALLLLVTVLVNYRVHTSIRRSVS